MTPLEWVEWGMLLGGLAALHLTWQTLLAGAAVAGLARLRDRTSARLRYAVGLTLFLALPAVALVTAWSIGITRDPSVLGPTPENAVAAAAVTGSSGPGLAAWAPWIGLAWLAGALLGALRLAGGTVLAGRLVASASASSARGGGGTARPGSEVRLDVLASRMGARLGLRRPVRVGVSERVEIPAVVGLARPTVLLPPRLLAKTEGGELEALLLHELSHVRRGDLIANAAQRLVGAILFFHPVARWISRAIDADRELCCDDLVARCGVERLAYARALARAALSGVYPSPGLGLAGGRVSHRVRRLMGPAAPLDEAPVRRRAGVWVAATLAAMILTTHLLAPASGRAVSSAPAWEARILADTRSDYVVQAKDAAGPFRVAIRNGRVVGARIDGTPLSGERIRQRGARVTFVGPSPTETFSVRLLATGGIEWPGRGPHGSPDC